MAVIRRYIHTHTNSHGEPVEECLIEVDAEVVGSVERTTDDRFYVKTKGLVPALDDIAGRSFSDVWAKIIERVQAGNVYLTKLVTSIEPAEPGQKLTKET